MINSINTITVAAALGTTGMLLCPPDWPVFQGSATLAAIQQPAWLKPAWLQPAWLEPAWLHTCHAELSLSQFELMPTLQEVAPAFPPVSERPVAEVNVIAAEPRTIDLAICLDTSGSMSGLIEAAKQKLWEIVNDLALAEPTPELRVALLTYGNDGHTAENGWVRIDVPFTEDLDAVSQQLFALTTNGGTELVGRVLHSAAEQLDWHPSDDALKLIVVAGNESADQDQEMPFRDVCKSTISRGIMINSIYCGNPMDDIAPAWSEVAKLADGHYASIDHNTGTVVIATPFDEELASLSASVNATYIPFGENGEMGCSNQLAQDANAVTLNSAAAASRAQTKASGLYWNTQWDLVDACAKDAVKLADVKEEDLPENMRQMTIEERTAYVAQMGQQRAQINTQINELNQKRQQFINVQMAQQQLDEGDAFDAAVRSAIRSQAVSKGFEFKQVEVDLNDCQPAPVINPGLVMQVQPQIQQAQQAGQVFQQSVGNVQQVQRSRQFQQQQQVDQARQQGAGQSQQVEQQRQGGQSQQQQQSDGGN